MNDPCTLYVTGVPVNMNASGFRNMFSRCGAVTSVSLLPPKGNFNSAAGFIDYSSRMEGLKAIQTFDNFKIGEHMLKVNFAKKKNDIVPNLNNLKIDLSAIVERNIEQSAKRAAERFKRPDSTYNRNDRSPCAVCKKLCVAACMSCKSVNYCGSSCQKVDWPRHKLECSKLAAKRQQNEQAASVSPIVKQNTDSLERNFDVQVGDALLNEVVSQVKSCMSEKQFNGLTSAPSTNHVDIPFPIKAGNNLQVQLIDLSSSGDIFCMVPTDEASSSKLDPLHHYYSNETTKTPSALEVGQYYACMFSGDKQWYRACILDISKDGSICSVWFVDYGNCEDTEASNLRVLTEEFALIPMCTIRCRLNGCDNVDRSCIQEYLSQALSDPIVEVEIVKILEATAYVQMYGLTSGKLCFINEVVKQRYMPMLNEIALKPDHATEESLKMNQLVGLKTPPTSAAVSTHTPVGIVPAPSTSSLPSLTAENVSCTSNGASGAVLASIPAVASFSNEGGASSPVSMSSHELPDDVTEKLTVEPIHDLQMIGAKAARDRPDVDCTVSVKSPKLHSVFNKIRAKALNSAQGMVLPELNVPRGKFQAIISHVVSINELYLSVVPDQDHQNEFALALKAACDKNFTLQPYKKGVACVFLDDTSGKWHRGKILAQEDNAKLRIHSIDFGLEQTVSYLKVGKLPAEQKFWVSPKALPCKLKGCSSGGHEYNQECFNLLKQCENELVTAEVTGEPTNGVYSVTLFMEDSVTVNWCINKLREEYECDDEASPEIALVQELSTQSEIPPTTLKPDDDVPLKFEAEATDVQKSNLKSPNVGFNAVSPAVGVELDVVVVYTVSPSEFYCQVIADELKDVIVQLARLNNGTVKLQEQDVFEIGRMCIAQASDNRLYRAQITSAQNRSCGVLFVDYGNVETVPYDKIRRVPSDLAKFNAQAVKCRLHGCAPTDDAWSHDCVALVKELDNQTVKAMFTGRCIDGHQEVKIFTDDGIDVSSILIDQGMAKKGNGVEQCSAEETLVDDQEKGSAAGNVDVSLPNVTRLHESDNQQFEVKLLMSPPVGGDFWMKEYARMVQQFEGKTVDACVVQKENEEPENWTLVIPNLIAQLATK